MDDIVLKCLFHRRFMDFNLCARLESASKSLLNHAHHFYSQLDSFDFKDRLLKENSTTCARKLAIRCPIITKIHNIPVNDDSLEENIVNFCFINKMSNVSMVGITRGRGGDWSPQARNLTCGGGGTGPPPQPTSYSV